MCMSNTAIYRAFNVINFRNLYNFLLPNFEYIYLIEIQ
jgi:hypothetical protein